jgi:hypothetical protein
MKIIGTYKMLQNIPETWLQMKMIIVYVSTSLSTSKAIRIYEMKINYHAHKYCFWDKLMHQFSDLVPLINLIINFNLNVMLYLHFMAVKFFSSTSKFITVN